MYTYILYRCLNNNVSAHFTALTDSKEDCMHEKFRDELCRLGKSNSTSKVRYQKAVDSRPCYNYICTFSSAFIGVNIPDMVCHEFFHWVT